MDKLGRNKRKSTNKRKTKNKRKSTNKRKTINKRKSNTKEKKRGCTFQHTRKYATRPSPPYPANECKHDQMIGNDGNRYRSVGNKNGVFTWKRV
jgi:hypothetical protein